MKRLSGSSTTNTFESFVRVSLEAIQISVDKVINQQHALSSKIESMEEKISEMSTSLKDQEKSLDFVYEEITDLENDCKSL